MLELRKLSEKDLGVSLKFFMRIEKEELTIVGKQKGWPYMSSESIADVERREMGQDECQERGSGVVLSEPLRDQNLIGVLMVA